MRTGVTVELSPEDRVRLNKLVANRNTPKKHAWRAEIVLLTVDGVGTMEIMRRTGQSKPTVWRWQARFAEAGVDGLLRDKTRPPGKKPLPAAVVLQVVTKTTTEHPTVKRRRISGRHRRPKVGHPSPTSSCRGRPVVQVDTMVVDSGPLSGRVRLQRPLLGDEP